VVLSSGFSEADAARRFADLKFDGFLQKPYRAEALVSKIRKAMARSSRG
jgi:DNA-binding NarL/FixJ family response regulator